MKPIIMSTEDVKAILNGYKTMKRAPISPQPEFAQVHIWGGKFIYNSGNRTWCWKQHVSPDCWNDTDWLLQFAPFKPGDVLWVRETWARLSEKEYLYQADDTDVNVWKIRQKNGISAESDRWMSPVTMPREAARLFLRVTDVRVERVQDITDEGSIKEGRTGVTCDHPKWDYVFGCSDCMNSGWREPPRLEFSERWDARNANRGHGWDSNPWVWVIEFERIEKERI